MKIIYYCSTGRHTSIFMANLHLSNISLKKRYKSQDLTRLKYFGGASIQEEPLFIGIDKDNNEIYTIGIPKEKEIMRKLIESFLKLKGKHPKDIQMIDADACSNPWIKLGIFLSLHTRFKGLARQLVIKGFENYSSCFLTTAHS